MVSPVRVRSVAGDRAAVYGALAEAFRSTLTGGRSLGRLTSALARLFAWLPAPDLIQRAGILHRQLREDGPDVKTPGGRAPDEAVSRALIAELEDLALLCARETAAWEVDDEDAARAALLEEQSHLRGTRVSGMFSGAEEGEDFYAVLMRITGEYMVVDRELVTAVLAAGSTGGGGEAT